MKNVKELAEIFDETINHYILTIVNDKSEWLIHYEAPD